MKKSVIFSFQNIKNGTHLHNCIVINADAKDDVPFVQNLGEGKPYVQVTCGSDHVWWNVVQIINCQSLCWFFIFSNQLPLLHSPATQPRHKQTTRTSLAQAQTQTLHISCDVDHISCCADYISCGTDYISCCADHILCCADHILCGSGTEQPTTPASPHFVLLLASPSSQVTSFA